MNIVSMQMGAQYGTFIEKYQSYYMKPWNLKID